MPFSTGPLLRYIGLGRYATTGPTLYVGDQDVFHIPDDFVTDLASVPRIFWAFLPPSGAYERAAVLHDWFCVHLAAGDCVVSARDADGIFRRVMRESGVGFVTRWILWTGVRWGALANPARRAGWLRDGWLAVLITALLLAVVGAAVYGLDRLAHTVF